MSSHTANEMTFFIGDNDPKTRIAALVRIACNQGNSTTLRDMACEHLARKVFDTPELAVFAAQELFAKRDAGTPPETVFDALLKLIRHAHHATSALFRDSVDAVSGSNKKTRVAAAKRVKQTLGMRRRDLTSAAA